MEIDLNNNDDIRPLDRMIGLVCPHCELETDYHEEKEGAQIKENCRTKESVEKSLQWEGALPEI